MEPHGENEVSMNGTQAKELKHQETSGVFEHTVNKAAFIDRLTLNVWGLRRRRIKRAIRLLDNVAIGGEGRMYGRCQRGVLTVNDNPFTFVYGSRSKRKRIPPFRIGLRSETTPLTCAQAIRTADSFLRKGFRMTLSLVELTFDVEGQPITSFRTDLFSRVRRYDERGFLGGHRTLYVGSPKSPWQLRIYDKCKGIVRFEFILRARYLKGHGIVEVHDVLAVNRVGLWKLVALRNFHAARLRSELARRTRSWKRDLRRHWPASSPLKDLADLLRKGWHVNPGPLLMPTVCQKLLETMLRNLIW
jgi:hypothetical protein